MSLSRLRHVRVRAKTFIRIYISRIDVFTSRLACAPVRPIRPVRLVGKAGKALTFCVRPWV